MSKTIGIIGPTISGNKGAAAMFESAVFSLEQKYGSGNVKFYLFSYYYKRDKKLNKKDNVKVLSASPLYLALVIVPLSFLYMVLRWVYLHKLIFNKEIKAISKCDVMLDMGGISYVDGREKYLPFNIAIMLPAISMGIPLVKCAQAMGTFMGKINRFTAKCMLPTASVVVSRGHITTEHLETIGLKNYVEKADYAFVLPIEQHAIDSLSNIIKSSFFTSGGKIVGICPSSVIDNYCRKHSIDHIAIMQSFVDFLINKGYNVLILPHSILKDTNATKNNDFMVCKTIMKKYKNDKRVLFLEDDFDSQQLRYLISKCNFFVASRFHAMISSLATKVPTLVVGWSHKYQEVLAMFELEKYTMDYKRISVDSLIQNFEIVENDETSIKEKLDTFLPIVTRKSLDHVSIIDSLIK